MSSFITNGGTAMCLLYHQLWNSGVSSFITNFGTAMCLRLSTMDKRCVFVYRQLWNSDVSSFIINDGKAVCLRLSPTLEQRCIFVYHQRWKSGVFSVVMKDVKKNRSRFYNMPQRDNCVRNVLQWFENSSVLLNQVE